MARTAYFRVSIDLLESERSALASTPESWIHLVLALSIVATVLYTLTQPVRLATPRSLTREEVEPVVVLPEVIVTAPRRTKLLTLDGSAGTR